MYEKLKDKAGHIAAWLKKECSNRRTIALFAVVLIVMYAPVWGGYLLYGVFRWRWCAVAASAYMLFWAGPFTPFFPVCLAITLAIARCLKRKTSQRESQSP